MHLLRRIAILLLLLFPILRSSAQTISREDFLSVIPLLEKADYKSAWDKTANILRKAPADTSDLKGIVIYMHIHAGAFLVSQGQLKPADFSKQVQQYEGQHIVLPGHPCIDSSTQSFNAVSISGHEGAWQGFVTATNESATTILSFEYLSFREPAYAGNFIGKNVRCGGVLKTVVVSGGRAVVCRLYIVDAFIREYAPN